MMVYDYGMGMQGKTFLGTYHWEGPEPKDGVYPQNPAETPEGIAILKEIRNAAAAERERNLAYAAAEAARMLEEKKAMRAKKLAECKTFVAKAEAEIAAEEAMAQRGGRRSTRRRFTAGPGLTVRSRARKSKSKSKSRKA
jgi:hypothetical protein